jgi:hypothetical protein
MRDLPRRVAEQVAEHDHGAVLRREPLHGRKGVRAQFVLGLLDRRVVQFDLAAQPSPA